MIFEGPTKIISHDYTTPSYVHHHHHLCHVLTMSVAGLSWWWVLLLLLLVRNREAMQYVWCRRLFGVPVILLSIVGFVTGWYIYVTLENHDEVGLSLSSNVFFLLIQLLFDITFLLGVFFYHFYV